ncbi:MAG TPA: MCE family protein, partial [Desulfobacteraceae bacterium]|nr:MCE family protein [Desulfobacteraceae bacterium]
MEAPLVKKRTIISPIWILPVVALVIGGWLIYKGVKDAGINIIVHFENAESVVSGKTQIIYRGIPVGTVMEVTVDENMTGVDLYIEMNSKTKNSLVEDTLFWIVRPEISAGRISGVNTLFSGSYVETRPGTSKLPAREFTGLADS